MVLNIYSPEHVLLIIRARQEKSMLRSNVISETFTLGLISLKGGK